MIVAVIRNEMNINRRYTIYRIVFKRVETRRELLSLRLFSKEFAVLYISCKQENIISAAIIVFVLTGNCVGGL